MRAVVIGLVLAVLTGSAGAQAIDRDPGWRQEQCRFKTVGAPMWSPTDVEKLIRCVSAKEGVDPAGAMAVWQCESGWAYEPPHSDCCHGPMQYMVGTFKSQFDRLKEAIRRRYGELAERVHNIRANITTAIVFVGHGGSWSPTWECG